MTFKEPTFALLFFCIPILMGLYFWGNTKRHKQFQAIVSNTMKKRLIPTFSKERQLWKYSLCLIAISLLVLGLMQPQFGTQYQHETREGLDIVIALDTSLSMLAEDVDPNRFNRAKHEITSFINKLSGSRAALMGFSGAAFTHSPLTTDYNALHLFIQDMQVGMMSNTGSKLDDVLYKASYLFRNTEKGDRLLVLYTDGEIFDPSLDALIKKANDNGIHIITVGIGTTKGAPIPIQTQQNKAITYKKDKDNNIIFSKLADTTLQSLSKNTGAYYFESSSTQFAATNVYKALQYFEKQTFETKNTHRKIHRYHSIVLLAMIILIFEWLLSSRRKKETEWQGRLPS